MGQNVTDLLQELYVHECLAESWATAVQVSLSTYACGFHLVAYVMRDISLQMICIYRESKADNYSDLVLLRKVDTKLDITGRQQSKPKSRRLNMMMHKSDNAKYLSIRIEIALDCYYF